ncbi:MAG: hypothetical protein JEZ04_07280 [Spirochaetales bacterium]|nr:hypothetical protein [Spirochaetales bacterium]
MTELLYYTQPDIHRFTALILSADISNDEIQIVLDRTAFYPEGGGQPADRGTINGLTVNYVRKEDGLVIHHVAPPAVGAEFPAIGLIAECSIEEAHRLDYMQQHSGQHVISAAMMKTGGIETVSVRQGEEYTAIETSKSAITDEILYRIEDEANRVITENVPIQAHWTDADGLLRFNLRRPSKHSSNIRIIEIPDVDCVACGGMHLNNTGKIGLVKYIRQEKIRGNIRTFWKIGGRAFADYREKTEIVNRLNILHSALQHELPAKTETFIESFNKLKFDYGKLQREYTEIFSLNLVKEAIKTSNGIKLIVSILEDRDRRFIDNLMKQFSTQGEPLLALIFNKTDDKMTWAVAHSIGGTAEEFDFASFRSNYLPLIGGKGGGKAPIWQGVAENPDGVDRMIENFIENA